MSAYNDYRYTFPATQAALTEALQGFAALQAAGLLGKGDIPSNMLGTPRDSSGNPTADPKQIAWRGDPGRAATSYTDPTTGQTVNVPAAGDPSLYYVAIRAETTPTQIAAAGIDPATYGLTVCDAATSAAVLGVWA